MPSPFYTNCYTNALREGVLHRCGRLVPHVGEHVRIGVQGYGDASVPKHLGDDLGVNILGQEQGRASVAQVVEPNIGQPGTLQQRLEASAG